MRHNLHQKGIGVAPGLVFILWKPGNVGRKSQTEIPKMAHKV